MRSRILLVLFFSSVLFCFLSPIFDPDFFWHLATGRWIWEHRQLPAEDPFAYTTSLKTYDEFLRAKIILTQYWLANLIQYGSYSIGGYGGIIALRLIVVFLTLLISYKHLRLRGLSTITSLIVLLPLSYILMNFKGDRPNQMTFLFLALFLYLIEKIRIKQVKEVKQVEKAKQVETKKHFFSLFLLVNLFNLLPLFTLPFAMVLWSNIHGGFIIGALVGILFIFTELVRFFLPRSAHSLFITQIFQLNGNRLNKKILAVIVVTLLAGFLNPNGYNGLYGFFIKETDSMRIIRSTVAEAMTPFSFVHLGSYIYIIMIAFILFFALLSLAVRISIRISIMRRSMIPMNKTTGTLHSINNHADKEETALQKGYLLEDLLLIICFGIFALGAVRVIPLLALATTPIIGQLFAGSPDRFINRFSKRMIPHAAILFLLGWLVYSSYPKTILEKPIIDEYYPKETVEFLKHIIGKKEPGYSLLSKRLFNDYGWGGFLIWEFYPEKVVFMDGRSLNMKLYTAYLSVIYGKTKGSITGRPLYNEILNTYSVKYIMIPAVSIVNGGFPGIIPKLVNDPEWKLIHFSKNCLLFTKEDIEPDYVKTLSYAITIENAAAFIRANPDNHVPYLTMTTALVGLGRKEEAKTFLEESLNKRTSLKGSPVEKVLALMREGKDILQDSWQ